MDGYVSKPITKLQLIEEINRVVVKQQSRNIWSATNMSAPGDLLLTAEAPEVAESMAFADFDSAEAMKRWGGEGDLILELALQFANEAPDNLESIVRAIQARNFAEVDAIAQAMVGSAGNLSATSVDLALRHLIEVAKEKDADAASNQVEKLTWLIPKFKIALMAWADSR